MPGWVVNPLEVQRPELYIPVLPHTHILSEIYRFTHTYINNTPTSSIACLTIQRVFTTCTHHACIPITYQPVLRLSFGLITGTERGYTRLKKGVKNIYTLPPAPHPASHRPFHNRT